LPTLRFAMTGWSNGEIASSLRSSQWREERDSQWREERDSQWREKGETCNEKKESLFVTEIICYFKIIFKFIKSFNLINFKQLIFLLMSPNYNKFFFRNT
jgi:hypothetical protein